MSDVWPGLNTGSNQAPPQAAGVTDVVTQLQGIVRQLTALVQAIKGRFLTGFFTAAAATTTTVTQPGIQANSVVTIAATNAAAATFLATHSYYYTITAGTSFTVTFTAATAGTETFSYIVNTST